MPLLRTKASRKNYKRINQGLSCEKKKRRARSVNVDTDRHTGASSGHNSDNIAQREKFWPDRFFAGIRMRRGQFGSTLVDIIVWLMIIGVVTYFITTYIVGAGMNVGDVATGVINP
jgi:hypothetical protein